MVDSPCDGGQTVLDRFFIDRLPHHASTHISELLLGIDPFLIEMPGEIDDETILYRRSTCNVVAPSADGNGEVIGAGKCDGERDVGGCADESDKFWTALCVGYSARVGYQVVGVGWCDEVAGEVGFEVSEVGHSEVVS